MQDSLCMIGGMPEQRNVRYLLEIAMESGAAVGLELSLAADQLYEFDKANQRIRVLQSGPRASVRLIILLPVIVLAISQAAGFALLQAITEEHLLQLSIAGGICLLLLARFISARIIDQATVKDSNTGVYLFGVALNLISAGSFGTAAQKARAHFEHLFAESPSSKELQALERIRELTETVGIPAADLVRRQAQILQNEELSKFQEIIERLPIRLLLPLGLLVLPAFILIALVPLSFVMLGF